MQPDSSILSGSSPAVSGAGFAVSSIMGFVNVLAGLMLVVATLLFFGGVIIWLARLGLTTRVEGIKLMEWGVASLFVLTVILGITRAVQSSPALAALLGSSIVVIFAAYAIFTLMQTPPEKKEVKK